MNKIDRINLIEINRIYARDDNDYDFNRYAVTAELRVVPFSKLASQNLKELAIKLIDENLVDFLKFKKVSIGLYDEDIFYSILYKEFEAETPVEEIFNILEAEQQKLQEKFTQALDKAYFIIRLAIKV